ncbi:hypothetical protein AN948_05105 [Rhodococcus sp. ADH]|uniref:DUF917 domain-containing protein n=1 Tax=Nocardiaceae TaxID=85025 RepID=UPI0006BA6220|nr:MULTISPECIES: DUF917 domain-containing protein [Rhodococcus]KPH20745.1 hypothetical protein AN948_05105 [Rhodococcus sp. ADH]RGP48004.1 hypothetical protein AWH04_16570 [Rhodococcus erythropolis]
MWELRREDLEAVAVGAGLLGSGGGGDCYWFQRMADHAFEGIESLQIVEVADLPDNACVVSVGMVGSLTALNEKPPSGAELTLAAKRLLRDVRSDRSIFVAGFECAGTNAFSALITGATSSIPVVDADAMGRGLSWLDQTTYDSAGVSICPFVLTDPSGHTVLYENFRGRDAERFIRDSAVLMGGWCACAGYLADRNQVARFAVIGTLSRAHELGRSTLRGGRITPEHPLVAEHRGRVIGSGRVSEVVWRVISEGGIGSIVIRSTHPQVSVLRVEARNEFLLVLDAGVIVARTPEIICLLRTRDGYPLLAESISVGEEVEILVLPPPHRWTDPKFSKSVEPSAFGLSHEI